MITVKYVYSPRTGVRTTTEVTWDEHYGLNNKSSYRFGVMVNGELLTGWAAYDYLIDTPILNGETLLEIMPDIPALVPLVPNPEYVFGMGEKAKTIPNPEYTAQLEAYNQAKIDYMLILQTVLSLTCKVTFPKVPYYVTATYYVLNDTWEQSDYDTSWGVGGTRRVTVDNEPDNPQYNGFLNYILALKNDKIAILKRLLMI